MNINYEILFKKKLSRYTQLYEYKNILNVLLFESFEAYFLFLILQDMMKIKNKIIIIMIL